MHWLVEVSRVGDTVPSERYCIDARRWQSALQEARRLRGDAGALPKLTIELTDNGYRAIDPQLKVRYLVSEAPAGMPVTDGARVILSTHPPPVESSPVAAASGAPGATAASVLSAAPRTASIAPVAASTAPVAASTAPVATSTTSKSPVAAGTPPAGSAAAFMARTSWPPPATLSASPGTTPSAAASAPHTDSTRPPADDVPPPAATISSVPPPSAQVVRQREEKPTATSPIAYRELALAVRSGTSRAEIEALLLARLEEVRSAMPADTRRFVQLAVFDHVFVKRPMRPPLGTLVWKDWRGEPSLSFPGFGEVDEAGPPSSVSSARMPSWSASMMTSIPPRLGSLPPAAGTPPPAAARVSEPPAAPQFTRSEPPPARSVPPNVGSLTPARVVSVGPSAPPPAPAIPSAPPAPTPAPEQPGSNPALPLTTLRTSEPAPADVPRPEALVAASESTHASAPVVASEAAPVVASEAAQASEPARSAPVSTPEPVSVRRSDPVSGRRSDPPSRRSDPSLLPHRRAPGEDLIGELFERMHELAFMADIPSGADYVLNVIFDVVPCEAMLVHVFDLGRREFVVVRAHGPSMRSALLFRTPDTDPLVADVMRQRSVLTNGASPRHSGAFERLGIQAKQILSGAARQGGRYLGIIEIANPVGGAPFTDAEKNALEYVCEQFADFVASRPLVLDEELVLRA